MGERERVRDERGREGRRESAILVMVGFGSTDIC